MAHDFSTKINHSDFEEMAVDATWSENDDSVKLRINVQDVNKSRITFTMDELRALVALGEAFEKSHKILVGS